MFVWLYYSLNERNKNIRDQSFNFCKLGFTRKKKVMAYDELTTDRIRDMLQDRRIDFYEKKMFGGLTFMVDDKMCIGVHNDRVMARIGPDAYDDALKRKGCRPMEFTGRSMKGYVFIDPEGVDMEEDLAHWVELSLAFNPLAKASKKRKK